MLAVGVIKHNASEFWDIDITGIGQISACGFAPVGFGWGAYLVRGTAAQLSALNALTGVVGICTLTAGRPELANVITAGVRTKLNTWLTARGYSTIPAGWTNRQVIVAVFQHLKAGFDLDSFRLSGE